MTLGEIVRANEGKPSTQTVEVNLADVQKWFVDQQAIMGINNTLRDTLLGIGQRVREAVK